MRGSLYVPAASSRDGCKFEFLGIYSSPSRDGHSGENSTLLESGVMDGSPHITYLLLLLVSWPSQCELGVNHR